MANEEVIGMVVKLAAESTDFQNQMTTLNRQMKVLQSDYKATASASKDFENTLEGGNAKVDYLSKAIQTQSSIVEAHSNKIEKINEKLSKLAMSQVKLKDKLDTTKASYDAIVLSQGKESEQAQKLAEEIKKLQAEYDKGNSRINATIRTLDNQTVSVNKAKERLNHYKNELTDAQENLEKLSNTGTESSGIFDVIKDKFAEAASNTNILGVSITDVIGSFSLGEVATGALGTALGTLASAGIQMVVQSFNQLISKVGEFLKSSLEIGETFQAQMSKVGAISNASAGEMSKLTDTARKFGAETQFSATEAAQALEYMSLAGWSVQQSQEGLAGILNLAAASAIDLGKASDIVTDYLTAFNMKASESNYLADVMAYTMSHSNTSTEQLAEAYKNCASTATSFGVSLEDTTAWLAKMADSGLKAGESGTTLNAILARIYGQNKNTVGVLKEYGIAIFDATGKSRAFTDIMADMQKAMANMTDEQKDFFMQKVAGTNQLSGFAIMCNTSIDSVNNLSNALSNAAGTSEKMAKAMNDNIAGIKKSITSKFEDIKISIFTSIEPIIKSVLSIIDTALNGVTKVMQPLGNIINAVLTPFSTIINMIMRIVQLLQNVLLPIMTGPISLLTSILNSIGTGLKGIYGILDIICSTIEKFSDPIINFLKNVGQGIEGIFSSLQTLKSFAINVFETIKTVFIALKESFTVLGQLIVSTMSGNISAMIQSFGAVKNAVSNSISDIKSIWTEGSNAIQKDADQIAQNVTQSFDNIAEACGLGTAHVFSSFEEMYTNIQQLDDETFGKLKASADTYFNEYKLKTDAITEYENAALQKKMKKWEETHKGQEGTLNYYLRKAEYQAKQEEKIAAQTASTKASIEKSYTTKLEKELKSRNDLLNSYSKTTYTSDYQSFAANEEAKTKKFKEEAEKRAKLGGSGGSFLSSISIKGILGAYANGTNYVPYSGSYLVGERGPEIVDLPQGAAVRNNRAVQGIQTDMSETNSLLRTMCSEFREMKRAYIDQPRQLQRLSREGGY